MLSQTTEYALRAIVFLADQQGAARTTAQIAEATQIPVGYLAKVMQMLGRARLVNAQRGLKGGFTLSQTPEELCVLDVVNAVDPIKRFHTCPLKIPTHGPELCPLHRRLDDAARMVEEAFAQTSVSELLDVTPSHKPLCRIPTERTKSTKPATRK